MGLTKTMWLPVKNCAHRIVLLHTSPCFQRRRLRYVCMCFIFGGVFLLLFGPKAYPAHLGFALGFIGLVEWLLVRFGQRRKLDQSQDE